MATEKETQNSTEKEETSVSVLVTASGKSFGCSVWFLKVTISPFTSFSSSSAWAALCMSSDGRIRGLKAQENCSGSGLILTLSSEVIVWLKSLKEQEGGTEIRVVVQSLTGKCEPLRQRICAVCENGETIKWSVADSW